MKNDIINFTEITSRHGMVQRGMNFGSGKKPSIILMSQKPGAPYVDKEIDGVIVYEGEDVYGEGNKKSVDQAFSRENQKFSNAVFEYVQGKRPAQPVLVYEKLKSGIWIDRGEFHLVGVQRVKSKGRYVFRFILSAGEEETGLVPTSVSEEVRSRNIPSDVQKEVYKRDKGICVLCGSDKDLHFDHILPFSKGGSNIVENIRILCARCNLKKSDKIGE